ncbi:hypothetical protein LTR78_000973 [Recurvomyces mirabilis]|uniref:Nudix hydrolase domain-containing protein n=1 Tax=Recurvomyces mirabilis TaxID=574656 RepID=A0AAE0WW55_9PEZI|nr:hypothetical protein LTR78_000973 [Recurvomyces mirabilis]KAK5158945.1 hypothetical protein LTS14_003053 [Recurvomyces mirabilis]
MANSNLQTEQYTAPNFTESCGAIAIKKSTRQICLIGQQGRYGYNYLLPKGRRNVGEDRTFVAVREMQERLTRAPPAGINTFGPLDHEEKGEQFMMTVRHTGPGQVKVIWWYIGAIDESVAKAREEDVYEAVLLTFEEALRTITYEDDRRVVREAERIFEHSYPKTRA